MVVLRRVDTTWVVIYTSPCGLTLAVRGVTLGIMTGQAEPQPATLASHVARAVPGPGILLCDVICGNIPDQSVLCFDRGQLARKNKMEALRRAAG